MRPLQLIIIAGFLFSFCTTLLAANFDISPRQDRDFSTGWIYIPKDLPAAQQAGFDDRSFERVSVPHANILTPHETFDPDMYRFVSWYRKHFRAANSYRGREVLVEFQGVMTVADVYLNGHLLGHHEGGYTPFTVDLTPALRYDVENVLAVRVDSREQKQVPPEGADKMYGYYLFGGIQRDVWLRVVDPCRIERVYYTTRSIQPEVEELAQISLTNGRARSVNGDLTVHLLDADGREVASTQTPVALAAGEAHDFHLVLPHLQRITLWNVDHPHRYVMLAELRDGSTVVDRERTWVGIRTIHWDAATGLFSLNDRPLKLRGMSRHQTFAYMGGAAPNRLQRRDARILKFEMGLNMMRSSHYPPDPEFLDECDRIGLLVMDEMPSWQYIGQSAAWQNNAVQAVREMILRDRNHPSIIVWGVRGNEASAREEDDRGLYTRTYGLVHDLDPSRPPGGARLSEGWHGKFVPDEVLTINDYSDWDGSPPWPQPATGKPWLITEYGNAHQYPVWEGERELREFTFHWMGYLDRLYSHPEIAGGIGWAAVDYNSPEFGTPVAATAHHCVDDIFRLPKWYDAYALAAQVDPAIYGVKLKILSSWRGNGGGKLYVASNAPEVELLVNGKSLGRAQPTEFPHAPHPLFLFKVDTFEPGELVAHAWMDGKVVATDTVRTPGSARRLVLRADDGELIADGADITRVLATAIDENGTPAPTDDRRIFITVNEGRFIGENPIHLEGGRIAFYVQSRDGSTRPITVCVTAEGLEPPPPLEVRVQPRKNSLVPLSDFDGDGLATIH
jgi:beta-galactosidase